MAIIMISLITAPMGTQRTNAFSTDQNRGLTFGGGLSLKQRTIRPTETPVEYMKRIFNKHPAARKMFEKALHTENYQPLVTQYPGLLQPRYPKLTDADSVGVMRWSSPQTGDMSIVLSDNTSRAWSTDPVKNAQMAYKAAFPEAPLLSLLTNRPDFRKIVERAVFAPPGQTSLADLAKRYQTDVWDLKQAYIGKSPGKTSLQHMVLSSPKTPKLILQLLRGQQSLAERFHPLGITYRQLQVLFSDATRNEVSLDQVVAGAAKLNNNTPHRDSFGTGFWFDIAARRSGNPLFFKGNRQNNPLVLSAETVDPTKRIALKRKGPTLERLEFIESPFGISDLDRHYNPIFDPKITRESQLTAKLKKMKPKRTTL
jgi:hypothetical protein